MRALSLGRRAGAARPLESDRVRTRPRRRGLAALVAAALALGLLALVLAGTHSGRTAVRTLFFLPEMFPNTPVRPLTWISAPPQCEEVTLYYADTQAVGDLCYPQQIVGALPEGEEREYLTALLKEAAAAREEQAWEPAPPPLLLSPVGEMVYGLVAENGRVDGEALLAALPPATRDTFQRLSPAAHVAGLRAPLFVMHDVGDTLIPFTESRKLMDSLPLEVPRQYDEFRMFEHVYPRDPAALLGLVPDLVQLYRHLYAVLLLVTD